MQKLESNLENETYEILWVLTEKYLNLGRAEETVEHESDGEISCAQCTWNYTRVKNLTIKSKVSDSIRGRLKGTLFYSFYTKV